MPSCVLGEHSWKARWKTLRKTQIPGKQRSVTSLPLAKAKPPPSRSTMFHGIFWWTTFQSRRAGGAWIFGLLPKIQKDFVSHCCILQRKENFLEGGEFSLNIRKRFCQQDPSRLELFPKAIINKDLKLDLQKYLWVMCSCSKRHHRVQVRGREKYSNISGKSCSLPWRLQQLLQMCVLVSRTLLG